MGAAYPELERERDSILLWARSEEEGFGRTLEQGTRLLEDVIERSREPSPPTRRSRRTRLQAA